MEQQKQKHPVFRFVSYDIRETGKGIEISYYFEADGERKFTPCWTFPKSEQYPLRIEGNVTLYDLAFGLGLLQIAFYRNLYPFSFIEIGAGLLDDRLREWFLNLCFQQQNDEESFLQVISTGDKPKDRKGVYKHLEGVLMPLDHRMETAVALELVKQEEDALYGCTLREKQELRFVKTAEISDEHIFSVACDTDCEEMPLPSEGAYAFATLILAYIHRLEHVVFAHTSSESDFENSILFERELQWFVKEYLQSGISVFSILRPMSAYQVVSLFAGILQYHYILEQNKGDTRLRNFCLLAPFLPMDYISELYGENILESESALQQFERLVGLEGDVDDEMNFTMVKAIAALELDDEPLPFLLRHYKNSPLYKAFSNAPDLYSRYFDPEHCLPERFEKRLRKECFGR